MEQENTKRCSHCKQVKPVSSFYKIKHSADGVHHYCRGCCQVRARMVSARISAGEKKVVDKKRCSCCGMEKSAAEFHRNRSYVDGLSHYCKVCRARYTSTEDAKKVVAVAQARRRAAHNRNPNTVPWWRERMSGADFIGLRAADVKAAFDASPFCHYCGILLLETPKNVALDHKQPKSRGGSNNISNIAIACKQCNDMKHTMNEFEFLTFLKEYHKRLSAKFAPELKLVSLGDCAAKDA